MDLGLYVYGIGFLSVVIGSSHKKNRLEGTVISEGKFLHGMEHNVQIYWHSTKALSWFFPRLPIFASLLFLSALFKPNGSFRLPLMDFVF